MSGGYVPCKCRDCMETAIEDQEGDGAFCSDCEESECEEDSECNCADAYDTGWTKCSECSECIPDSEPETVNDKHAKTCSLHPENVHGDGTDWND